MASFRFDQPYPSSSDSIGFGRTRIGLWMQFAGICLPKELFRVLECRRQADLKYKNGLPYPKPPIIRFEDAQV